MRGAFYHPVFMGDCLWVSVSVRLADRGLGIVCKSGRGEGDIGLK